MTARIYLAITILILAWSCWQEIGGLVDCYPDSAGNCYLTKW